MRSLYNELQIRCKYIFNVSVPVQNKEESIQVNTSQHHHLRRKIIFVISCLGIAVSWEADFLINLTLAVMSTALFNLNWWSLLWTLLHFSTLNIMWMNPILFVLQNYALLFSKDLLSWGACKYVKSEVRNTHKRHAGRGTGRLVAFP